MLLIEEAVLGTEYKNLDPCGSLEVLANGLRHGRCEHVDGRFVITLFAVRDYCLSICSEFLDGSKPWVRAYL